MHHADISPLPWNAYGFDRKETVTICDDKFNVYRKGNKGIAVFCIHGAGYTGLSFAQLAEALFCSFECQIIAIDLRGHGETECIDDNDLSKSRLTLDVINIYNYLFPENEERPYCFLIGHSMGGAVAIRLSYECAIPKILALVVIDVVEGTALAALADMPLILRNRPKEFKSLEYAIRWASTSIDSLCRLPGARQSIPSMLKKSETGSYRWVIDLSKTKPFWEDWFIGISQEFLNCKQGKILIIGDIDRLDVALTRAEMQGKYQNVVIRDAGHAIHENDADAVCQIIKSYYKRFAFLIEKHVKISV